MEKRWILALTLCAIFFIIWTTFVAPPPPAEKPAEPGKALPGKEQPQQEAPPPPVRRDLEKKDVALTAVQKDVKLEENISFDAGLMSLVFTNRGASLKSVSLKKYKALDGENNLVLLREFERIDQPRDSLSLRDNENLLDCDRALYEITDRTDNKIAFELQYDNGLIIKKVFTLHPDEYVIGVDVTVSNVNKEKPLALDLSLLGAAGISTEESRITSSPPRDIRAVVGIRQSPNKIGLKVTTPGKLRKGKIFEVPSEDIEFAGIDNSYFLAVLIPGEPSDLERARTHLVYDSDYMENALRNGVKQPPAEQDVLNEAARNIAVSLDMKQIVLLPAQPKTWKFDFYVGPKDRKILKKHPGLENLVNLGGLLRPIAYLFLWLLNAFHKLAPNYGLAIIFLTVVLRIAMHPLSKKSQASIYKMQKIQPKIKNLQEKHKHDKQKLTQEQMKLWREQGENPLSGCLTGIVIQIPIFITLFRVLRASIELRQAPFVFWIDDLSQPDVIFRLPFNLPFLNTNAVSVLPILMIASMIISQHFMPKSSDPKAQQQQKMMKLMPIFFGFIFYTFPSGLVLYWLVSNILQIVEQRIIRRELDAADQDPPTPKKRKADNKNP